MSDLLDVAVSLPTVIFTVLLAVLLLFWLVTSLAGLGELVDIEPDSSGEFGDGPLGSALAFLGVAGLPAIAVATTVAVFAWATSALLSLAFGDRAGVALLLITIGVVVVALFIGFALAAVVLPPIARQFEDAFAPKRRDFVGRVCTVTTLRVDADFGQAEVADPDGGSLLVQVRCDVENALTAGSSALIIDLDDEAEAYQISPDVDGLV